MPTTVGDAAVAWIVANRAEFGHGEDGKPLRLQDAKPLFELALMARCHASVRPDQVAELGGLMFQLTQDQRLSERLPRTRTDIVVRAFLCGFLDSRGYDVSEQRKLIARAVEARILEQAERLPHRIMEERLALDWCGVEHALPSWSELIKKSVLGVGSRPLSVHVNQETAYQLTHVILFHQGFGTGPRSRTPLARIPGLQPLLSELLVTFCGERHWDLVGELLLCWDCLGFDSTLVYRKAWDAFRNQQADDGSFRGPELVTGDPPSRKAEESATARRRFLDRYHTTLVAILACDQHRRRALATGPPAAVVRDARKLGGSRLREVVTRDAGWLHGLLDVVRQERPTDATAACGIVVGLWLCRSLVPAVDHLVRDAAGRAAGLLSGFRSWPSVPPTLSILTRAILAEQGVAVPALDRFVHDVSDALLRLPPQDAAGDLELSEKRVLLAHSGLGPLPPRATVRQVHEAAEQITLHGDQADDAVLLLWIGSATWHGTATTGPGKSPEDLLALLSALAVRSVRRNDLRAASRVIRHARYLGLGDTEAGALVEVVVMQQRLDGGYGFFGDAGRRLDGPGASRLRADLDLVLPTTLDCLWMLAESASGWRLFTEVGGLGPTVAKEVSDRPMSLADRDG